MSLKSIPLVYFFKHILQNSSMQPLNLMPHQRVNNIIQHTGNLYNICLRWQRETLTSSGTMRAVVPSIGLAPAVRLFQASHLRPTAAHRIPQMLWPHYTVPRTSAFVVFITQIRIYRVAIMRRYTCYHANRLLPCTLPKDVAAMLLSGHVTQNIQWAASTISH